MQGITPAGPPNGSAAPEGRGGPDAQTAVRVEGLSKTFVSQRVLDDVSLEIRRGEIHALVGQNGSGKSTLIKILSGFHKPDPGARAWFGEREASLGALAADQREEMKFIHQDLALVPTLTVRENLFLERARGPLAPFQRRRERAQTREMLARFDLALDPDAVVGRLSQFQQSAVAIMRALGRVDESVRLLVLDEPTASMGASEVGHLFQMLRKVRDTGVGILYVSHILAEVLSIGDRVSVLRDGRMVACRQTAATTEQELIELIVGRGIERVVPPASVAGHRSLMSVKKLSCTGLREASFTVHAGEILGVTGLVGSGYEQIAECLGAVRPWSSGSIEIDGQTFTRLTPAQTAKAGIVCVPADRRGRGLIGSFTVAENITLPAIGQAWRRGLIRRGAETRDVARWMAVTGVHPADPQRAVQELSGGNQQKVMLAKALRLGPRVLVLADPTQAVDVGASAAIRKLITDLADQSRAIVVASSDAEELEQICHRVLVTRGGRIVGELVGAEITEDRILTESHFEGASA